MIADDRRPGWGTYPWMGFTHVIPHNDERNHALTGQCWCRPALDPENMAVVIHHSADGREFAEVPLLH